MKKIITLLCFIGFSLTTYAEMLLWKNGEFTIADLDSITFLDVPHVEVSPNELSLMPEEQVRLSAIIIPNSTAPVNFTWTSDNEEVAAVSSSGIVTAVANGTANIIASVEGFQPDTCVVIVSSDALLDNYQFAAYGLFGQPTMVEGTEKDIEMSSGASYRCQLGYTNMYAWDNGITFSNGNGFSGAGYFFASKVLVYWIIDGDYAGHYVGSRDGFYIAPISQDTLMPYTLMAGELVDLQRYGDFWDLTLTTGSLTDEQNAYYVESQIGTNIYYINFDDNDSGWYLGNVAEGHFFKDENGEQKHSIKINWYDYVSNNRLFGLLCNLNNSGNIESIVKPYDMRIISKVYTNAPNMEQQIKRNLKAQKQYTIGEKIQSNTEVINQVMHAIRSAVK